TTSSGSEEGVGSSTRGACAHAASATITIHASAAQTRRLPGCAVRTTVWLFGTRARISGDTDRLLRIRCGSRCADQVIERAQRRLGAFAHGDDDLLVGGRRGIAGCKYTCHGSLAACVDFDLAARAELDRALQPIRVRQQADLDEDAFDVEPMQFTCAAILVRQTGDLAALAVHLGRLSRQDDSHVRQAAELALQDLVRPQTAVELDHRYVRDDAGQINRGLYAGVPAADHRHALALEQRAVAVRA